MGHGIGKIQVLQRVIERDAQASAEPLDMAGVRRLILGEYSQQRRFAATVGADNHQTLPACQIQRNIIEEQMVVIRFGQAE